MSMEEKLLDYRLQGYCCSQIVMEEGLHMLDREDPLMVEAGAGLCFGMNTEKTCGILTAAAMVLALWDQEQLAEASRDLMEWFEETYGALDCETLLAGNPLNKVEQCPAMIQAVLGQMQERMELD